MEVIDPHRFATSEQAFDGFGNRSRSFDGVDDEVIVSDSPSFPTGAQTWSCWVKPSRLTFGAAGQDLMTRWGAQGSNELSAILFLSNAGQGTPQFLISDNGSGVFAVSATNPLTVDTWHHVVGVFTPSTSLKLYIDGVLDNTKSSSIPSAIKDTPSDFVIGWRDFTFDAHFKGNICDCRIYDTDLTATEISDLYNGTNITTNLVGHWLTDADNLLDAAGTNHGTNYGSKYSYDNPSPAVEFGSASRVFDGASYYVDLGNSTDFSFSDGSQDEPFSLCAWIKCDDNARFRVLSKDNGAASSQEWLLATDAGGNLNVYLIDGGQFRGREYATPLPENEWIHVASTYDGSGGANFRLGLKLYVNGVQVDNADYGFGGYVAMDTTTNNVFIGRYGTSYSDGKIADARIYDAELSSTDIASIYNGTNVTTNLIGHWLTDNDDVEDKAGTNDGTNFGSTYSYDNPPMDLVPSRQRSRSFDGFNDYVDLGDSDDFSFTDGAGNDQPFSLSCWVNMDTNNKFRVLHKSASVSSVDINELFFGTIGSGEFCFLISGNSNWYGISTPTAIAQNEWVHISATYDGSGGANFRDGMNMYINGVAISHVDFGSTGYPQIANNIHPLYLGKYPNNNTYADGRIADVRIYDAELTASQILDIYNGTTDRTNLIGQWLTNSDDVLDHAGTNDGTNVGSTYSTDSPS